MVAQDEEVDEVHHQLTKDNGELVPRHEHASDVRGSHLTDIHRTDGRSQSHADTTNHTIDVEHDEQRVGRSTMLEEHKLRLHRSEGGDEEQQTGDDQRLLTSEVRGEQSGDGRTDDTADECRCRREAVPSVGVGEVLGFHEKRLQTFLCT